MKKINFKLFETKCPYKLKDMDKDIFYLGSLSEKNFCKYFYYRNVDKKYIFCKYKTLLDKLDKLEELLD